MPEPKVALDKHDMTANGADDCLHVKNALQPGSKSETTYPPTNASPLFRGKLIKRLPCNCTGRLEKQSSTITSASHQIMKTKKPTKDCGGHMKSNSLKHCKPMESGWHVKPEARLLPGTA